MTDLEMTRLCAEAMGLTIEQQGYETRAIKVREHWPAYDPLRDDAQAMALVKKFGLSVERSSPADKTFAWSVELNDESAHSDDLNRAIVECVAKMREAINAR